MMEFLLIFGETYLVEVPKIHEIYGPQKRAPYGILILENPCCYGEQCWDMWEGAGCLQLGNLSLPLKPFNLV